MNFLSYPVFLIIQVITSIALIGSAVVTGFDGIGSITLLVLGVLQLIIVALSKHKKYTEILDIIDVRLTTLFFFVVALLLTFSPYLLSFVDSSLLVITTTAVSAVTLLSFIFTDIQTTQEEEI